TELEDSDARETRGDEVPEFVHEHHHAQNREKSEDKGIHCRPGGIITMKSRRPGEIGCLGPHRDVVGSVHPHPRLRHDRAKSRAQVSASMTSSRLGNSRAACTWRAASINSAICLNLSSFPRNWATASSFA